MSLLKSIKNQINKAHPDHSMIAKGMAWVALFVLAGSLARAAKEVAIAYHYGISVEVDAYLFVFNLLNWPVAVWFGVLTVVLVPLVARIQQHASGELFLFKAELFGLTILIGILLLMVGWFGLPALLQSALVGLPVNTKIIAINIAPLLSIIAPLGVVASLFSAWMLAGGRHSNTLLESVPAITILIAILAFPRNDSTSLVWGTIAGFVFHLFSLSLPLRRMGWIVAPKITHRSQHWSPFWQGFGIMLAGQLLMSFASIIDQFFAAHLGIGAIATLSYANRILSLILGIGAMAVSRATLPVFSRAHAQGDEQVQNVAIHWVGIMFALGIITMLASWILAPLGVKLLFERGAFTPYDTKIVVEVLRYGLTQLPFYFAGMVLVSLLSSQGRYRTVAIIATSNLIVKSLAMLILTPLMQINAIAISTSIMYGSSMLLLILCVKRDKK